MIEILFLRSWIHLGLVGLSLALMPVRSVTAQETAVTVKELILDPAPIPPAALAFRLLPRESDRTPGDAAPIYLRVRGEINAESWADLTKKTSEWISMPLKALPVAEARALVDQWRGRLELIALAARRAYCDWSYTLPEQRENSIEILLPDVQDLRIWGRLIALKARVEIAERKYDEAARTIATGLSFSRHLAEGPFLINALVGIANANVMLSCVEELISQPEAPNVYWSLATLPDRFISLRKALDNEQMFIEWMIPELTRLDEPRTTVEWDQLLIRATERLERLRKLLASQPNGPAPTPTELAALHAEWLPAARAYLKERRGLTDEAVAAVSDSEAIMHFLVGRFKEMRDDVFKFAYISYPDAARFYPEVESRLAAAKSDGPLGIFREMMPSMQTAHFSATRLDRQIAALCVVEALRLHADRTGALPTTLGEVTAVPLPLDPITGQPFAYALDGDTATLTSPGRPDAPQTGLSYRIQLAP